MSFEQFRAGREHSPDTPEAAEFPEQQSIARRLRLTGAMPAGPDASRQRTDLLRKLGGTAAERKKQEGERVAARYAATLQTINPEALEQQTNGLQSIGSKGHAILRNIFAQMRAPASGNRATGYLRDNWYGRTSVLCLNIKRDIGLVESLRKAVPPGEAQVLQHVIDALRALMAADPGLQYVANTTEFSKAEKHISAAAGVAIMGIGVLSAVMSLKNGNKSIIPLVWLGIGSAMAMPQMFRGQDKRFVEQFKFLGTEQYQDLAKRNGIRGSNGERLFDLFTGDRAQRITNALQDGKISKEEFMEQIGATTSDVHYLQRMSTEDILAFARMVHGCKENQAREVARYYITNGIDASAAAQLPV